MKLSLSYLLSLALLVPVSSYADNTQERASLKFAKAYWALNRYLKNHGDTLTPQEREKYTQAARLTRILMFVECKHDNQACIDQDTAYLKARDGSLRDAEDAMAFIERIELTKKEAPFPSNESGRYIGIQHADTTITEFTPEDSRKPYLRTDCINGVDCASYRPDRLK